MMQKIKAVLFDLGGVVINIHFDRCFQSWANSAQLPFEHVKAKFKFDDAYASHEVSAISGAQYHAHICDLIGAPLSVSAFLQGWNAIYGEPFRETLALIRDLKSKYRIYAFTNSNPLHREVWQEKFRDELTAFDRVFCSSQLKHRKPDAAAFARIVSETKLGKNELLFIDDLKENVEGARAFGIQSVLFDDPLGTPAKLRDLLLPGSLT